MFFRVLIAIVAMASAGCAGGSLQGRPPVVYETEQPIDSCYIDLRSSPIPKDEVENSLVRAAQADWTRANRFDGRMIELHKAIIGRTKVEVFYVFDIAGVSDLYVVYATDPKQSLVRRWFWYGSMYGICED